MPRNVWVEEPRFEVPDPDWVALCNLVSAIRDGVVALISFLIVNPLNKLESCLWRLFVWIVSSPVFIAIASLLFVYETLIGVHQFLQIAVALIVCLMICCYLGNVRREYYGHQLYPIVRAYHLVTSDEMAHDVTGMLLE